MCAKVIGPLYSLGASGKFGDAMVFLPWKGLNVVRQWLVPANPQSANQGDVRVMLALAGKTAKVVETDSTFAFYCRDTAPSGQTWISFYAKQLIDNVLQTGANVDVLYTAYSGHGAKATFISAAATAGLAEVDKGYSNISQNLTAGFQLYLLALAGIYLATAYGGTLDTDPFNKAIATWDSTDVGQLATAIG